MKAGWELQPLGEVSDFLRGLTYAKSDEVEVSSNVVLRATNIDLATNQLDFSELKYISDTVTVPTSKKVKKDSLLICTASGSKSHLGKVALVDDEYDYAFGGFMGMLTPRNQVTPKFLFYLLTSGQYKDFIADLSDGANINNLKFSDLQKFLVPIPSLPEQQRIVAILDEAFADIATARAAAEQNRQNARALFESHLQSIFTQRGEGWRETTVRELVSEGVIAKPQDGNHGEIHPVKADFVAEGVPFIMASDLHDGIVDTYGCRFISEEQAKSLRIGFSLDQDVLLSHKGTIGRVAILHTEREYVMLTPQVTYYRVLNKRELFNRYLYFYFQSPKFQSKIWEIAGGGSTRAYIGITRQLELDVLLPPLEKQIQFAEQLEELASQAQRLESLYTQKLAALDALKQSLLHQAFSGQL